MFEGMQGKSAIVTGALSGIGREAALLLSSIGIRVALAGRSEEKGKQLEQEIIANGGEAHFIKADVSIASSVEHLVEETIEKYGQLDYALNNAGTEGKLAPLSEIEESDFDQVMATNLKGVWLCLKYQLPRLQKGGAVVNISTNITRLALPGAAIYTASKAGVEALTQVAAIEYGMKGVRVNTLNPGAVETPMLRRIIPKEGLEELALQNPLRKNGHPEEIAKTALFLLSPLASHINGESLFVDGGASLSVL